MEINHIVCPYRIQETKRIQRAIETAFNRSMFLISPVQSLPLPPADAKLKADVLIGEKFLSNQEVTFKDQHFSVGPHKTQNVMILSCKII